MSAAQLRFVAWSDYLCPWCANASLRLHRVEKEFPEIEIEWRSYLLRPRQRPRPSSELEAAEQLEKFRHYARSWARPAQEADAPVFRQWESDASPPSHSMPAQVVGKAALRVGRREFRALHQRLMSAYFTENRDISNAGELRALWSDVGIKDEAFPVVDDPELVEVVAQDHAEALELGVTGVPAVMRIGNDAVVVGAQPLDTYRRWVERSLERDGPDPRPPSVRNDEGGRES